MRDTTSFIRLNVKDGKISGHAVCNNFNGGLSIEGSNIRIFNVGATKMLCKGIELEKVIMTFLNKATTWSFVGDTLIIKDADGSNLEYRLK